jgi:hypothetical protein
MQLQVVMLQLQKHRPLTVSTAAAVGRSDALL